MTDTHLPVDPEALRAEVRDKYRQVALQPERPQHFHRAAACSPAGLPAGMDLAAARRGGLVLRRRRQPLCAPIP